MLATVLSIGLGVVAEFVLFAAPVADILDIVHQSLGAVAVGIVLVAMPSRRSKWVKVLMGGAAGTAIGLGMIIVGAKLVGIV